KAEDGIRDWSVTGVQTCALPILLAQLSTQQKDDLLIASAIAINKSSFCWVESCASRLAAAFARSNLSRVDNEDARPIAIVFMTFGRGSGCRSCGQSPMEGHEDADRSR